MQMISKCVAQKALTDKTAHAQECKGKIRRMHVLKSIWVFTLPWPKQQKSPPHHKPELQQEKGHRVLSSESCDLESCAVFLLICWFDFRDV